jgi:hypothetical protein
MAFTEEGPGRTKAADFLDDQVCIRFLKIGLD